MFTRRRLLHEFITKLNHILCHIICTYAVVYMQLLVPLVSTFRYDGDEVNMMIAKSEVLHEKMEAKDYNDGDLIKILTTRSKAQISATLNHFKNKFGTSITKYLKEDSDNEYVQLLKAVIKCLTYPEKYFEKVLRQAINKMGPDEWGLTRVVTTRAEFDMERIREEYLRRNSVPLDRAIAKDTHGDYEDILLALIGHGHT